MSRMQIHIPDSLRERSRIEVALATAGIAILGAFVVAGAVIYDNVSEKINSRTGAEDTTRSRRDTSMFVPRIGGR